MYDLSKTALFELAPQLKEGMGNQLLAALAAGLIAGIFAALASQPGDTVFTKLASTDGGRGSGGTSSGKYGPLEALGEVVETQGLGGLYAGAGPRAVFAGSLLALEFVIYDFLRSVLHVASGDLVLTLDVLGTLQQAGQ